MTPRPPRITATQLDRALRRDGWYFVRQTGSHRFFAHPVKPGLAIVPIHAGKTIGIGLLKRILRDAGLSTEELEKLL